MNKSLTLTASLLAAPLFLNTAFANEQPTAEDLVGKFYGGAHLFYIDTDNDRLMTANPNSNVDHGSGFGGEAGYRLTETTEFRFSYTNINLVRENAGFSEPSASSAVVDALYFPTKQNFYVVGGVDYLDIVDGKTSLDLGAGYRHYFTKKAAIYFEGKGHYQFSNDFVDASARIGFVYFFGGDDKSTPVKKKQPETVKNEAVAVVAAPVAIEPKDLDNDHVVDEKDHCPDTPVADKVDEHGCTVFTKAQRRMELLVNFDSSKSVVKEKYFPEIEKMADFLKTYPEVSLIIEGHTSKTGSASYNKKISQQRADAIVKVLVNQFSVDPTRLSAVGYGEERLLELGDTAEIHAINRRIEAKVETTEDVAESR